MSLDEVFGKLVEGDKLAVLVSIDLVEEITVTIEDISGLWRW
jgi:hypothetical protein